MAGTKELGEVVKFVCSLASAAAEAAKDGKVTLSDAVHLMPLLYALPSAIDGWDDLIIESTDLDEAELDELSALVKESLDLPNDDIEEACEEAIDCAIKMYSIVQKLRR